MTADLRQQRPVFAAHRQRRWPLAAGIVATALVVMGAFSDPQEFFRAYLFTYVFVLGLPLGSLALVMVHELIGGAWGLLVRRIFEAQMRTLWLGAIGFLPIAFGLSYIYWWADSSVPLAELHGDWQAWYLEPKFFFIRAAIYFAVWLGAIGLLAIWSRHKDQTDDPRTLWKLYNASALGLVLFGVAMHFASIDWVMSAQPGFTSTIIGPLVFSGQALSALALTIVVFTCLADREEYRDVLSSKVLNDLGSLLFTLIIIWAYLAWFQFLLIWMADLPRGVSWYAARLRSGWDWLALAIVVFQFVIPFFLLLVRRVKQDRRLLGAVAAWVLFMQLLYDYCQVMPAFENAPASSRWMELVMPIAMGGLWFSCFYWQLGRRPLLPVHDLNYPQALHLRALDEQELAREEALKHV